VADGGFTLIGSLLTGGLGAAIGTAITAVIQVVGHKSESRASAADLVTHAAGGLAEQQDRIIDRLTKENEKMRKAVWMLSDVIDELLPKVDLPAPDRDRLKKEVRAAKATI